MNPIFSKGQLVRLVNTEKIGFVCEDPKIISGEYYYTLFIENSQKTYSEESLESAEVTKRDLTVMFQENDFAPLKDFMSYLTYIKIERPLSNNLYAFLSSRTEFQVHQFKPVLKYLSSPYQRLLIADEVGVGKTIEAGIIYTELLSRYDLKNVLIICPSALQYKWQKEMKKRFDEDFPIIDSNTLKVFFRKYERYPNGVYLKGIVSIQMLRNEDILQELERLQIPFDLVIIDEAHHMRNESTKSNSLGKILSGIADGMVLLSATPLQLGDKDLFNLLNIMLPGHFDNFEVFQDQVKPNEFINLALLKLSRKESLSLILQALRKVEQTNQRERFLANPNYIYCAKLLSTNISLDNEKIAHLQRKLNDLNVLSQVYTRTKKKEISTEFPLREPITINVEINDVERAFYQKISDLFLNLHPGCPPGFLLQMPLRQVASCIPASIEYLKDMYGRGIIDLSEEDYEEDISGTQKIAFTKRDLENINYLIKFAEENITEPDSKTIAFIKTIKEAISNDEIKKIIIFSFFKRTLRFLERKLKALGLSVVRVDGDVPFIEREKIIDEFAKYDGYQILLSSDVGGEGLDMQFCSCMFNYDLPWNPMKIEQRIGRLDRYGQKSPKIHIYNFSIEGTIESDIFLRLCNRIGVFEQYIGELEPILGNQINQLTKDIINPKLTPEQQKIKADQTALVIENKKQELELFDRERKRIIGQNNYFTEQISDILKNEKFITPLEITNFVGSFINDYYPRSKFKALKKNSEIFEIRSDPELKAFIRDFLKKVSIENELIERFLDLTSKDYFEITFDYKIANEDQSVEFVTLRHPLVKAIISFYKKEEFKSITKIRYFDQNTTQDKNYLFFIYLLEISSFTNSLTFVPVVVDIQEKTINNKYSESLFEILKTSTDLLDNTDVSERDLDICKEISENLVIDKKRQRETELKEINDSLVNDQLSSLKQTFEIKTAKIDETIKKIQERLDSKSVKILKMKETQKINLTRNYENKRKILESNKKVIVSHELICGGIISVRR